MDKMNIKYKPNGWTVEIADIDLSNVTQEEVNIIGCLVGSHTVVVIKNQQHLTINDDVRFIKMFGEPDYNKHSVKRVVLDDSERIIRRVTGKKDDNGDYTGLFPLPNELGWHANPVEDPDRKSVVYLRAIEGTQGSVTSFTNHVRAYETLPRDFKFYLEKENLHSVHEHITDNEWTQTMLNLYETTNRFNMYNPDDLPPLIYENKFGTTGLYFSWDQFSKFKELSEEKSKEIRDKIRLHVLSDQQNIYDHEWENGDIILSDQWLGLHKRHKFESIADRLLYRAVVEYTNIDQTKKSYALSLVG